MNRLCVFASIAIATSLSIVDASHCQTNCNGGVLARNGYSVPQPTVTTQGYFYSAPSQHSQYGPPASAGDGRQLFTFSNGRLVRFFPRIRYRLITYRANSVRSRSLPFSPVPLAQYQNAYSTAGNN